MKKLCDNEVFFLCLFRQCVAIRYSWVAIIFLLVFSSCKRDINEIVPVTKEKFEIENYRIPGESDYELIQRIVDSLPEGSDIYFGGRVYTIDHTVIVTRSLNFFGPATFIRENQIRYELKEPATEHSRYLILDKTEGLRVPDRFLIANDVSYKNTTQINIILKISGDTVFLNAPLGKMVNGNGVFDAGTALFKNINFFWIIDPREYPRQQCSFENILFDGNRDNNRGSYSWLLNASITALTKGPTTYRHCSFINSPGETILGHNAVIINCHFKDLNGSAFHTSADRVYNTEPEVNSYLSGNLFENTNQISTTINGHSEGCITHSNSGGYYTAVGNKFVNVGESVLGALYPALGMHDWGTNNIRFSDNEIWSSGRMIYLIDTLTPGDIYNVNISENEIYELNPYDWTRQLLVQPGIILENEVNQQ